VESPAVRKQTENRGAVLTLADKLATMKQVHIPNGGLGRQALDADSTLFRCSLFANPHNSKLGLILLVLDMKNRASPDRTDHSMQYRSLLTDVSDLGVLGEGHGLGVNTPDTHRQECGDTSIATTIHICCVERTHAMVWHEESD